MLRKYLIPYSCILALLLFFSYSEELRENAKKNQSSSLLGSWEMNSIQWVSRDTTYTIPKAQPGMLMIDKYRYSLMWTPTEIPRVPFVNLSSPTDDEIKTGFRSIVFNSGTYRKTDATLTTKAFIAKVPGFEGGTQFYNYKIERDSLQLTMFDETYPDGSKPSWSGIFVTQFTFNRVQ